MHLIAAKKRTDTRQSTTAITRLSTVQLSASPREPRDARRHHNCHFSIKPIRLPRPFLGTRRPTKMTAPDHSTPYLHRPVPSLRLQPAAAGLPVYNCYPCPPMRP
ncbi:hypothetical protein CDEST_06034 [Colletotrichum destructivum]|uniref:Uncharacterized protein n=1 Tax=Colletotrichum destructivum TaxID=34406 RepID=A0AAX4ICQ3_9PEZI|nr:hypothetical protein CDEST_06034 [Colletotrichum destructivum]